MTSRYPWAEPLPWDVRRTGPELRALIRRSISEIEMEGFTHPLFENMREWLIEMQRRSPKYTPARRKHGRLNPQEVIEIRKRCDAAEAVGSPLHSADLAVEYDTSTREISYALVGMRDGRPVFDRDGRRIRTRGSAPDPDPEPEPDDGEPWMS